MQCLWSVGFFINIGYAPEADMLFIHDCFLRMSRRIVHMYAEFIYHDRYK